MKNILLTLTFLSSFALMSLMSSKDSPEPIQPISRVNKPFFYYHQQANLWQAEMLKDKKNATAWWNYFKAARYSNMKAETADKKFDLGQIAKHVNNHIPNSFENHYIQYLQGTKGSNSFEHLLKAYEIAPERPEIMESMATYYEVNLNREKQREMMQRIFDTKNYSPGALKWNYNMLMSVEQDGILLTWGDNDTYPSWILQLVQNVRPDVKVINTSLMIGFDDYRTAVFERNDIPAFDLTLDDVKDYSKYAIQVIEHICKKSLRPVYLATNIRTDYREAIDTELYMTGLALKYSTMPFDNMAIIKNNYENKFLKDYLTVNFEKENSQQVVDVMNRSYLPFLIKLQKHYHESGETSKATNLKNVIKTISEKTNDWSNISKYLGENQNVENINSSLVIKDLDRNFGKIKDNLYAATTELMNKSYEAFLMDLLKNRDYEKLAIAKNEKINWRELLPNGYKDLPDSEVFKNGHPDDPHVPVQNISHEAAELYCQWITQVYNQSTDRKKKYKKVIFRLPTEDEWIYAARGSHQLAPFTWGGYYYTNAKGCFLSNGDALNFDVNSEHVYKNTEPCDDCPAETDKSLDGGFFPVIAAAYFPNDYGCYNMSGNVAEMINTQGIAMGGSWADVPDECQVTSKKNYEDSDPTVGFRVFMEVLEYKK